jgi:hypothetical protein
VLTPLVSCGHVCGHPQGGDSLHLHHYFLAWSISLLAQFQHPLSVGLLAVTAGIFVQGIGVSPSVGMVFLLLFSFRVRQGAVVSAIPVGDSASEHLNTFRTRPEYSWGD